MVNSFYVQYWDKQITFTTPASSLKVEKGNSACGNRASPVSHRASDQHPLPVLRLPQLSGGHHSQSGEVGAEELGREAAWRDAGGPHLGCGEFQRVALQDHQLLVTAITTDQLRAAITHPAQHAGLVLKPGLVETILTDLREEPDHCHSASLTPRNFLFIVCNLRAPRAISLARMVEGDHHRDEWEIAP